MKKYILTLAFVAAFSASARADSVVIGASCDVIGASQMTSDQQNIAVCLKNTAGKQVWKSMQGSSSWTDVPITDKNPFDLNCEYRFFVNNWYGTGPVVWYPFWVSINAHPSAMFWQGGDGSVGVEAANKTVLTFYNSPITSIQKRCPNSN